MSYTYNPIYTHFQGDKISRSELMERMVVETIQKSKMPDSVRRQKRHFEIQSSDDRKA